MKSQTEAVGQVILCVDEQPDIVQSLRCILRHLPYRIINATDRVQALQMLQEIKPVLVLTELKETGQIDRGLKKALKKSGLGRIPIVAISESLEPTEPSLDGIHRIQKPLDNTQVLNLIEKLLG